MSIDFASPEVWSGGYLTEPHEYERLAATLEMVPDDASSLLDVGAANGEFLKLAEEMRPSLHIEGVEMSQAAIDHKLCKARIVCGSTASLPYGDCEFDVVTALEVFEHLPYGVYEPSIAEVQRVAGRYIVLSVPYDEVHGKVRCPRCLTNFDPWGHLRSFDEKSMEGFFPQFRPIAIRKIDTLRPMWVPNPLRIVRRLQDKVPEMPELVICPACRYSRPSTSGASGGGGRVDDYNSPSSSANFRSGVDALPFRTNPSLEK